MFPFRNTYLYKLEQFVNYFSFALSRGFTVELYQKGLWRQMLPWLFPRVMY